MGRTIDITGKRFGRLSVIGLVGYDYNRAAIWKCICDCGKEVIVTGSSLRGGSTKSCGCLCRENVKKRNKARAKKKVTEQTSEAVEKEEKKIERENEVKEAMQRPIDKSQFDDWWMFGDHETDNQKWFNYFIR